MRSIACACMTACCAVAGLAQNTGSIGGRVLTAAGGGEPVPNAPVEAKNESTGASYSAKSAANGSYSLSGLAPGNYEITVNYPPIFLPFSRKDVAVQTAQTARLDVRLDDVLLNTLGDSGAEFVKLIAPQPAPKGLAPRTREGKPDLSGVWLGALPSDPGKPEPLPWVEALSNKRLQEMQKDIPSARCLPFGVAMSGVFGPTKFVQTSKLLLIMEEGDLPRQVFLDGRSHPKDPNPSFYGHSIGRWEKDTLMVDTSGLNGLTWINFDGFPQTEMQRVTERFRRPDLGHLEVEVTVDDPSAFQKPWTMKRVHSLAPKDVDILEYICEENERDRTHTPSQ